MKITKEAVKALNPCAGGYAWYLKDGTEDLLETLLKVNAHRPEWARWLFSHIMDLRQRRRIAVFAAELVLDIFEKKYPGDLRPRKAIEAAKAVLENDTPPPPPTPPTPPTPTPTPPPERKYKSKSYTKP